MATLKKPGADIINDVHAKPCAKSLKYLWKSSA